MKLKIVFAVLATTLLGLLSCEKPSEFTDRESYQVDTLYIYQKDTVYVNSVDTLYVACDCGGGAQTPDTPDNPDTPDTPDTPDNPDVPDSPQVPGIVELPESVTSMQVIVDFVSQPFTEELPVTKSALDNKDYILDQGGYKYTFTINCSEGKNCIYMPNDKAFRLNADGSSNTCYIKLPQIKDLSLTKVYVKISNSVGTGKKLYINSKNDQETALELIELAKKDEMESQDYTFELTGTDPEVRYWLCSPAKATQFTRIELTYEK